MSITFILALLILVYFSAVLLVARRASTENGTNLDFYLLGDALFSNLTLTITLFATLFSAFTFVGLPGMIYSNGVGPIYMMILPIAIFGAPMFYFLSNRFFTQYSSLGLKSPIEMIMFKVEDEGFFTKRALTLFIFALFALFMLPLFIVQIAGVGKIVAGAIGIKASYYIIIGLFTLISFFYIKMGGLRGIIRTDFMQGLLGLILVSFLSVVMLNSSFNGFSGLIESIRNINPAMLSLPGPLGKMSIGFVITNGLVFSLCVFTHISMLNRILILKSSDQIKKVSIGFSLATILLGITVGLLSFGAFSLNPALDKPDLAIMTVIKTQAFSPTAISILMAFFILVVLAGAMSTTDSIVFSLATAFSLDLKEKKGSQESVRKRMNLFIALYLGIALVLAINPPKLVFKLGIIGIHLLTILSPVIITTWFSKTKLKSTRVFIGLILSLVVFIVFQKQMAALGGFGGAFFAFLYGCFYYPIFARQKA